jgi:rubredoxin
MSKWKCGKCGKEYSYEEFHELKSIPLVPEDTNPYLQHGFTHVCECGYVFGRDRWHMKTPLELKTEYGPLKVEVSTVFLELNHGTDENPLWYETMVFPENIGNHEVECWYEERYETKEEAIKGHEKVVNLLKNGKFKLKPLSLRLIIIEEK